MLDKPRGVSFGLDESCGFVLTCGLSMHHFGSNLHQPPLFSICVVWHDQNIKLKKFILILF
jgi:hypothetical protein